MAKAAVSVGRAAAAAGRPPLPRLKLGGFHVTRKTAGAYAHSDRPELLAFQIYLPLGVATSASHSIDMQKQRLSGLRRLMD